MKNVYLAAAIAGAIIPYLFFIDFFMSESMAIGAFLSALFVNGAAGGFSADVFISSAVFWIYLFSNKEKGSWRYVALNLTIGLSCALPYFLYVKAKQEGT